MYLGIDVGGTKTLVASLENDGVIKESRKFPTPQDYQEFLKELERNITQLNAKEFKAIGVGIPATSIYREEGIALTFSNLGWRHVYVQQDIEQLTNCPTAVENDAKLAGLSESMLRPDIHKLVYVTVSTGIGYSLITEQKIDPNIGDGGGSLLLLEHKGKLVPWESFASGKAIVETFGKMAKDINDTEVWQKIARNISLGLIELVAMAEPEVIVIGGSVGVYLNRFIEPLNTEMRTHETPLVKMPTIEAAIRPEEAVVYGCYDYAKQVYG